MHTLKELIREDVARIPLIPFGELNAISNNIYSIEGIKNIKDNQDPSLCYRISTQIAFEINNYKPYGRKTGSYRCSKIIAYSSSNLLYTDGKGEHSRWDNHQAVVVQVLKKTKVRKYKSFDLLVIDPIVGYNQTLRIETWLAKMSNLKYHNQQQEEEADLAYQVFPSYFANPKANFFSQIFNECNFDLVTNNLDEIAKNNYSII